MQRLIDNKLIYGQLMEVAEPHLVERYNLALTGFGLAPVELERFRIDMAGFSPEVAGALGDELYLDPNGVNRRFIILSPEQIGLPVVNTAFSNTEELLYQFFEKNAKAIYALTIKDVLYGEIEDSVFEVNDIDDLLSIEQVEFRVQTASNLLGKAGELQLLIEKLLKQPDAWRDNELLNTMVEYARVTGDIRTNTLLPQEVVFRQKTYWTSHFGGVYVFIDDGQVTVICDPATKGFRKSRPWQVSYIDRSDHDGVYRFLAESGRVDPPRGSWIERSQLLQERALMLVTWLAVNNDLRVDLSRVGPQWAANWAARHAGIVEREGSLPLINWVHRQVANWSNVDMREISPQRRFLISRANPEHADFYLVNRLISDYLQFDYMTRFVFNKPAFYRDYENWPENYRDHVVKQIRDNYLADKKALRRRLYK
ncbi:MAG: hypothetical protein BroJett030_20490 [Alphaproteobacteria bacterium]|nr:MAG: hypothetical protein BroJett030_20490 [Alphaproteobacteria bacterium]